MVHMVIGHNLDFGLIHIMVIGILIIKEIHKMESKIHQKIKMEINIILKNLHFIWHFLLDQVSLGVEIVPIQENII